MKSQAATGNAATLVQNSPLLLLLLLAIT